jgi:hypothetical protein
MSTRLSNHFTACRLVSLARVKAAAEYPGRDANGPYIIAQRGYAPGDVTMQVAEFVLGRSGAWLATHWFIRMPVPERRREFLFANVAEVVALMESLTSEVRVIREKPALIAPEAAGDEELEQALGES